MILDFVIYQKFLGVVQSYWNFAQLKEIKK